eukprot:SAG31_NODE_1551_length_7907_cov_29.930072_3_plen_71_part_00
MGDENDWLQLEELSLTGNSFRGMLPTVLQAPAVVQRLRKLEIGNCGFSGPSLPRPVNSAAHDDAPAALLI